MAQKPALRHVLGQVRLQAGLSQSGLAKILGCAAVTVQKIEQGNLSLSVELATKAQEELGIKAAWLLANDSTKPAVTVRGGLWTKDAYEFAQGSRWAVTEEDSYGIKIAALRFDTLPIGESDIAADAFIALTMAETNSLIYAMLQATRKLPKQGILIHRLQQMLKALKEDFKPDEATLKKLRPEIQKARKAYEAIRQKISAQEVERMWSDNPGESKK
jgi:transcriptional regulator with XRE-family HTH domain